MKDEFIDTLTAYMEAHKQQLFHFACYHVGRIADAEDILQSLYLRLLERHIPGSPVVNLEAYVWRSLANACASCHGTMHCLPIDSPEAVALTDASPGSFEEEYEAVNRLLSALPQENSEVIRMKIHGSLTFDAIASILEISPSAAKRRYYNGLEILRSKINI